MSDRAAEGGALSIGELARATGIPVGTLRTWERRYGYPAPKRRDSGHRRYPLATVTRLRAVRQALAAGHRPSTVLPMQQESLEELVAIAAPHGPTPPDADATALEISAWFELTARFDGEGLARRLQRTWPRLGSDTFIYDLALPFFHELGERWERGELSVAHEHFASEQLRGLLAQQWRSLSEVSTGPTVVLANLPGEQHCLALHIAGVLLALADRQILYLGADTPLDEIAAATHQAGAEAVVIGSSPSARIAEVDDGLRLLRAYLDPGIVMITGGTEEPLEINGVAWLPSLRALADWAD